MKLSHLKQLIRETIKEQGMPPGTYGTPSTPIGSMFGGPDPASCCKAVKEMKAKIIAINDPNLITQWQKATQKCCPSGGAVSLGGGSSTGISSIEI